jgi:AraC-like DNA-binding protein
MPSSKPSENEIEPLIPILQSQVIPCWERFGADRLAVTAKTLKQFNDASPPALMRTSVKKRVGKKTSGRNKGSNYKIGSYLQVWQEDNLAVYRYPALIFMLEGQADFQVGDYVIHCPQDHFLLFASGMPRPMGGRPHFEENNTAQRKCSILWFFAPPGTNSVISYVCHSEGEKHFGDEYRIVHRLPIIHLFQLLIEELENRPSERKDVSPQLLEAFLHLFLDELQQGHFQRAGHSSHISFSENSVSSIEQARRYITTHLNKTLTAENVAQAVYMSRSNFLQHFKHETGQTFHEFMIGQRMEEAGRLLSEGHWSINYVSQYVGLRPAQFRVQFKKYFGKPPSEFREKLAKERRSQ